MGTTIQVSDAMAKRLRKAKSEYGVETYEEVLERLFRVKDAWQLWPRVHGRHPQFQWNKATDRMKFRTEE